METGQAAFWSFSADRMLEELQTSSDGLSSERARDRLDLAGSRPLKSGALAGRLSQLAGQFKSPIILILLFAAGMSFFLRDPTDAIIILVIVLVSGLLGYWQEHSASNAVEKLLSVVRIKTSVLRDGERRDIPVEEVVPGDVVIMSAGGTVPGDCLILESKDLFVNEAALTGETFPVPKEPGRLEPDAPLARRSNSLFMGTHVVSGTARALVVHTGQQTEFGQISARLKLRAPETEFERGVRRFGYLLMEITLLLVLTIFALNVLFHRPVMDSFLFSLALAVGLTPQLLPAIISINLSRGASRMAGRNVIVKRLASIENFGSMDVLCSDKTGTLTEGVARLHSCVDIQGNDSDKVLFYAYINAAYQTGFSNPIDEAIKNHRPFDLNGWQKLDEVP